MKRIEYKAVNADYSLNERELNTLGNDGYVLTNFAAVPMLDGGFAYITYVYVFQREVVT